MSRRTRSLKRVRTGVRLVLAALIINLLVYSLSLIAAIALDDDDPAFRILPVLAMISTTIAIVGRVFCLAVPKRFKLHNILYAAVACDCSAFALELLTTATILPDGWSSLANVISLAAFILFVVFLMRLADRLELTGAARLAEDILWTMGWIAAIVVLYPLTGVVLPIWGSVPGLIRLALTFILLLALTIKLIRQYASVLRWISGEIENQI